MAKTMFTLVVDKSPFRPASIPCQADRPRPKAFIRHRMTRALEDRAEIWNLPIRARILVAMTSRARKVCGAEAPAPSEEAATFVRSLEKHGQAVQGRGPLPAGATHRLTVRKNGEKRVKRKRFSAV